VKTNATAMNTEEADRVEEAYRIVGAHEAAKLKAAKLEPKLPIPIAEFCAKTKTWRSTIWRLEKRGEVKLIRIGRSVFINPDQFTTA